MPRHEAGPSSLAQGVSPEHLGERLPEGLACLGQTPVGHALREQLVKHGLELPPFKKPALSLQDRTSKDHHEQSESLRSEAPRSRMSHANRLLDAASL